MQRILAAVILSVLLAPAAVHADGAYLGVILGVIDDDAMKKLDYEGRGAFVVDVVEESPADQAGMKDRDIVIGIDKEVIIGPGHLRDALALHRPGDTVAITVWRKSGKTTLQVKLGKPEQKPASLLDSDDIRKTIVISGEPRAWLGIRTQELSEQLGEHFGSKDGVLVSEVIEGGPAAGAGLMAGDVIVKVGTETVEHPLGLTKAMGDHEPGDKVALVFIRDGKEMTKEVELAETPEKYRKGVPQFFTWDDDGTGFGMRVLPNLPGLPQFEPREFQKQLQLEDEAASEELRQGLKELRESLTDEIKALRAELDELKKSLKHTN
ncbi:MAG: PDZ domain-containing protein [Candidatus Eisenbacteria bacterium]|jgi:S1-C subfamily serine protease|nr:PDZ domain-containing protein [Candidatus Eisenbacteria bacterium]